MRMHIRLFFSQEKSVHHGALEGNENSRILTPPPMPTINVTDEAYTDFSSRQSICYEAEENAILYGR